MRFDRASLSLIYFAAALSLSVAAASAAPVVYKDLCEASAAVAIGQDSFAVASDESNKLRVYERGVPAMVGSVQVTPFDKSDIEGAANLGDKTFWISSMSLNKAGEDKPKRKVLFATVSTPRLIVDKKVTPASLAQTGNVYGALRDPLLAVLRQLKPDAAPKDINVEGLAAGPGNSLMIGLRSPGTSGGDAIVARLTNPLELIGDTPPAPIFDTPIALKLEGRGIRSFEQIGTGAETRYLIVAGPSSDNGGFALYNWDGVSPMPTPIQMDFEGIKPEAMFAAGNGTLQFLGDNDDNCDEEDGAPSSWWFPSIERAMP